MFVKSIGMVVCMTCTAPCTPMLPSMPAMNCTSRRGLSEHMQAMLAAEVYKEVQQQKTLTALHSYA